MPTGYSEVWKVLLTAHWADTKERLNNQWYFAHLTTVRAPGNPAGLLAYAAAHWAAGYALSASTSVVFDKLEAIQVAGATHNRPYYIEHLGYSGNATSPEMPRALAMVVQIHNPIAYGRSQRNRYFTFGVTKDYWLGLAAFNQWFYNVYHIEAIQALNHMIFNAPADYGLFVVVFSPLTGEIQFPGLTDIGVLPGYRLGRRTQHPRR